MSEYIYLIREREFCRLNEPTYKIGKSKNIDSRIRQYPKNSELILIEKVKNCDKTELILLNLFRMNFQQRKEYGNEYFTGNPIEMRKLINSIVYRDQLINTNSILFNSKNFMDIFYFICLIGFDRIYIHFTHDYIFNTIMYIIILIYYKNN